MPDGRPKIDRQLLAGKAEELDRTIRKLGAMRDGLRHAAVCPAPSHMECPTFRRLVGLASELKTTKYFDAIRTRRDRAAIRDEWIERVIRTPFREQVQADGRIRRWARIPEAGNRYLRVVLLAGRRNGSQCILRPQV